MKYICRLAVLSLILCVSLTKSITTKDSNSVFRSVPQKEQPIQLHVQRQLSVVQGVKDFFSNVIDLFSKVAQFFQRLINDYQFPRIKKAASDAFSQKNYKSTVKECTKALKIQPENNEMLFLRARAYFHSGQYSQAISACENKGNKKWKSLLIRAYFEDGQYENVISNCGAEDYWKAKALDKLSRLEEGNDILEKYSNWNDNQLLRELNQKRKESAANDPQRKEHLVKEADEAFDSQDWSTVITKAMADLKLQSSFEGRVQKMEKLIHCYMKTEQYDKALSTIDEFSAIQLQHALEKRKKYDDDDVKDATWKNKNVFWIGEDALKVNVLAEIKTRDQLTRAYKIIGTTINKGTSGLNKIEKRLKNMWIEKFENKLYYPTLGLSYGASKVEIEETYDELADKNDGATREAYQVLSIPLLKDEYDNYVVGEELNTFHL